MLLAFPNIYIYISELLHKFCFGFLIFFVRFVTDFLTNIVALLEERDSSTLNRGLFSFFSTLIFPGSLFSVPFFW